MTGYRPVSKQADRAQKFAFQTPPAYTGGTPPARSPMPSTLSQRESPILPLPLPQAPVHCPGMGRPDKDILVLPLVGFPSTALHPDQREFPGKARTVELGS